MGSLVKSDMMRLLTYVLLAILVCSCRKEEQTIDVFSRLQDVSRLELSRMTVTKVGMISDVPASSASGIAGKAEAFFNNMKIGNRIGVYSYDTYLIAYIDLGQLRPEDVQVDEKEKVVRISLPPVEVMTDGREPELHEEHSRVTGLRSEISPAERARLKSQMAAEVRDEIASDSEMTEKLRESARIKAKAWISELVTNWGYTAEISD